MPTPRPLFVTDAEVASLLAACRVLVAVSARSAGGPAATIDAAALRTLLVVADLGYASPGDVAQVAGLNPATVERHCERLVQAALLEHTDLSRAKLTLAAGAHDVIAELTRRRRDALRLILGRLPAARQLELMAVLTELARAATATDDEDLHPSEWAGQLAGG